MNLKATQATNKRGTAARAPLNRNLNHTLNPSRAGGIKIKRVMKIKPAARGSQLFKATHEL